MDAEAGRQFEDRVRAAMTAADVPSLSELARASGIKTQVLYSWFRGEKQPRPNSLRLVAQALRTTPAALVGDAPLDIERGEAPSDLASEIAANTAAVTALAMELRNLLPHEIQARLAELEAGSIDREGRLRSLEVQVQTLLTLQGVAGPGGRRLPRESAG